MKLIIVLFLMMASCGYPDIDSVPNFKDLKITQEEAIDLCNLSNTDTKKKLECISKIKSQKY